MKLTTLLLFSVCLQTQAHSYGQSVTIHEDKAAIQHVFDQITRQTGVQFLYADHILERAYPVTIHIEKANLEKALEICFSNQPLMFELINGTVGVKLKKELAASILKDSVYRVSGRVTAEGKPLEGVSVSIKNSDKGAFTDMQGRYSLEVKPASILVFSSMGYQPVMEFVGGRTVIDIDMEIQVNSLDQTIVIAYGSSTRRYNTGSVGKVSAEEIQRQPALNPLTALSGRITGMVVTQSSGVPGSDVQVQIRGQNSVRNGIFNNGNFPLYIIDGVPFASAALNANTQVGSIGQISPFSSLNPADIESIEALKDADATAIYGSRGANGVVLITTKKGKEGKAKLELNLSQGMGRVTRRMKALNTQQYLQMRREAFANDGEDPTVDNAPDLTVWDTLRYTDWQKELVGGYSHASDAQLSLSGGTASTRFIMGGGFHSEKSVFPGSFIYRRGAVHATIDHVSLNKKFKASLTASYFADRNNLPQTQLVGAGLTTPPNAPPIFNANGKLNFEDGYLNPFGVLVNKYRANSNTLLGNLTLSYEIMKALIFKVSMGYTKLELDERQHYYKETFGPSSGRQPFARFSENKTNTWIVEPQLHWSTSWGSSKIAILAGATAQQTLREGRAINANNYSSDILVGSWSGAGNIAIENAYTSDYRYAAIFGRVNYSLRDTWLVNITGRRDGSSRFGPGKQFANFGAIGAAWIFTQSSFFKKAMPWMSFGKLRTSYGITGNDQINDYGFLSTYYSSSAFPYQGNSILYPQNLYNADYHWETNKKFEAAIELGFVHDKILFSASWYRNRSGNQLVGYPLPRLTGFTSIQSNLDAVVQNTGLEIELQTVNYQKGEINWSTSFNITIPRNKLVSYPDIKVSSYRNIYTVGSPLDIQKKYQTLGVDPATGIYQFRDVDNDGFLSSSKDGQFLKRIGYDFYGGFQNSVQYKNWQLVIFFQFVKQTGKSFLYGNSDYPPGARGNQPVEVLDRWQKPGDEARFQKFTQGFESAREAFDNYVYYGDHTIVDASFIRLKNVYCAYQVPLRKGKKATINGIKVFMQAQNALTITNYLGFDPENQSPSSLPPLKLLACGIQLSL